MSSSEVMEITIEEEPYHLIAFECWYSRDRNFYQTSMDCGYSMSDLMKWSRLFSWSSRADARDVEAARMNDRRSMERRHRFMEDVRSAANSIWKSAFDAYVNRIECARSGITSVSDGFRDIREIMYVIERGIALERQAEGLPDWMAQVVRMSNEDLLEERKRLLREINAPKGVRGRVDGSGDTVTVSGGDSGTGGSS